MTRLPGAGGARSRRDLPEVPPLLIRRGPDDGGLKPGEWQYVRLRESHTATVHTARVSCPKCGFEALLDHAITEAGLVCPSVVCVGESCSFHEYIRLEGWTYGER